MATSADAMSHAMYGHFCRGELEEVERDPVALLLPLGNHTGESAAAEGALERCPVGASDYQDSSGQDHNGYLTPH